MARIASVTVSNATPGLRRFPRILLAPARERRLVEREILRVPPAIADRADRRTLSSAKVLPLSLPRALMA